MSDSEIQKEIESAVALLSQSIGIREVVEGSHMIGLLNQVGGHLGKILHLPTNHKR